jgi:hypothetical protein
LSARRSVSHSLEPHAVRRARWWISGVFISILYPFSGFDVSMLLSLFVRWQESSLTLYYFARNNYYPLNKVA